MKTVSKEEIALKFAQALIVKEGSLSKEDVINCFGWAENFLGNKIWIKEYRKHIKEVREAQKTRRCGCGHDLKDGEIIYDNGWQYGYECSRCR